jgi:hypothetical protein
MKTRIPRTLTLKVLHDFFLTFSLDTADKGDNTRHETYSTLTEHVHYFTELISVDVSLPVACNESYYAQIHGYAMQWSFHCK